MAHAHSEYFRHLLDLVKKEREEDRQQYERKISNRSLEDRKKEGVTWHPVIMNRAYLGTGEKWILKLEKTTHFDQRHMFQSGSSVSVFLNKEKGALASSGVVSQVNDKYMTVVLNKEELPDWLYEGKLGVNLLFDEGTYEEMEKTLRKLAKTEDPELIEKIKVIRGEVHPPFSEGKPVKDRNLNESQNSALELIGSAQRIALVHGPPGTGKTTTSVEAIVETLKTESQLMVTAASNAAVDLLVEKLTARDVRVLRLGHPARLTPEVMETSLDVRLSNHQDAKLLKDLRKKSEEMRSMAGKYKRNFGRDERLQRKLLYDEAYKLKEEAQALEGHMIFDELNRAQVVACTLIGANHNYLHNRHFKTLFVDEASQALEPAIWIPIMKCDRVVMAGDHWQLPPTIKSIAAAKEGLADTIFNQLIRKEGVSSMLETQYRMHPDIMQFSNEQFYDGRLKCGELIAQRRQVFERAVQFIDTAGCGFEEKRNPETLSTYNKDEASFLLKRLDALIAEHGLLESHMTIGIIAPYKAQTALLTELIASYDWFREMKSRITINSVDAFQGQERDVIMMSMVRSNDRGEIGFLADKRRMNVAMTRARHLLMMVGDSATLGADSFFDALVKHVQETDSYKSAFEFLYD